MLIRGPPLLAKERQRPERSTPVSRETAGCSGEPESNGEYNNQYYRSMGFGHRSDTL
ncbi:MAG: hypothetical protein LBB72_07470 [Spirochaetaceae bacterium]|nr:hypothetical protein [Spirochaetaceae bacterium]